MAVFPSTFASLGNRLWLSVLFLNIIIVIHTVWIKLNWKEENWAKICKCTDLGCISSLKPSNQMLEMPFYNAKPTPALLLAYWQWLHRVKVVNSVPVVGAVLGGTGLITTKCGQSSGQCSGHHWGHRLGQQAFPASTWLLSLINREWGEAMWQQMNWAQTAWPNYVHCRAL